MSCIAQIGAGCEGEEVLDEFPSQTGCDGGKRCSIGEGAAERGVLSDSQAGWL